MASRIAKGKVRFRCFVLLTFVVLLTVYLIIILLNRSSVKSGGVSDSMLPVLTWGEDLQLKVVFLNLPEGEATLILTPEESFLIDTGSEASWSALQAALDGWKIKRLNGVFLSSPEDPWSGNAKMLQDHHDVDRFMLGLGWSQKILFTKQMPSDKIVIVQSGDSFMLKNGARIDVLNPSEPLPLSPHNQSLVLRLTYGDIRFLFMGTVDEHSEEALLTKYDLHTEVLKVSTCGAPWATSEAFLRESDPQVAVTFANCGLSVDDTATKQRLLKQWVELYETAEDGVVMFDVHRDDYDVSNIERQDRE